jgi:hypothetical protein
MFSCLINELKFECLKYWGKEFEITSDILLRAKLLLSLLHSAPELGSYN